MTGSSGSKRALRQRLAKQWADSVENWFRQDQSVRTGFLDTVILDSLGDARGKNVIDIGCGEGRFSRVLGRHGASVTGVDLTQAFIDRDWGFVVVTGRRP